MSNYHKLRVTVEVEIPHGGAEEARKYIYQANEGFPDPMGCTPVFWAMQEASDAVLNKMHDWRNNPHVQLQIVAPQEQQDQDRLPIACDCDECKELDNA
jgi:hypothetical protein